MRCVFLLLVLLGVLGSVVTPLGASCPQVCSCRGGVVDCSGRRLTSETLPPSFPSETSDLLLHENLLTALPPHLLSSLHALRRVTLHANSWTCDCAVLYLRAWLLKNANDALIRNVSCTSPPGLRGRLVAHLVEEEVLSSCRYWLCDLAVTSQVSLFVFIVVQVILLGAVIHFLRRFDRLTCDARRSAHPDSVSDAEMLLNHRNS